jgi:8-oxo-dGTP diphosphatase
MSHPLKWEFPGGKLLADEDAATCLKREISEELGVTIEILERLPSTKHTYPVNKKIELIPFRCAIVDGAAKAQEHEQILWLHKKELTWLDWVEADIPIVEKYLKSVHG